MDETENIIRCPCPLYACRVCRTKTLWRHQAWCALSGATEPGCTDCRYHDPAHDKCAHPARERRRRTDEKNHGPLRA